MIAEKETPWQTPFAINSFGDSFDLGFMGFPHYILAPLPET